MTEQRKGMLRRLAVDLACLSCGDDDTLIVEDLQDLGPLPRACVRCKGGSVVAVSMATCWIADPRVTFDWAADAPKIGRPPGAKNRVAA